MPLVPSLFAYVDKDTQKGEVDDRVQRKDSHEDGPAHAALEEDSQEHGHEHLANGATNDKDRRDLSAEVDVLFQHVERARVG